MNFSDSGFTSNLEVENRPLRRVSNPSRGTRDTTPSSVFGNKKVVSPRITRKRVKPTVSENPRITGPDQGSGDRNRFRKTTQPTIKKNPAQEQQKSALETHSKASLGNKVALGLLLAAGLGFGYQQFKNA